MLKAAGCKTVFREKLSGREGMKRPELEKAIEALGKGDVLVLAEWECNALHVGRHSHHPAGWRGKQHSKLLIGAPVRRYWHRRALFCAPFCGALRKLAE
jgi:hypothetical protein